MRKFLIIGAVAFSMLAFSGTARACSCNALQPALDQALANSANVAVLELAAVTQAAGEKAKYSLSVVKAYKGSLKGGEVLGFEFVSSCHWYFTAQEIGNEFLMFLDERPAAGQAWVVSKCTRSKRVKDAAADLRYLENETKLRGKTRLSGTLQQLIEKPDESPEMLFIPLAGRKLQITGNGRTIDLVTDKNGAFEIFELPPGQYRLRPEKVPGYAFSSDEGQFQTVEVKGAAHTEQNFYFSIDNAVSGKVVDPAGKPFKDACVGLISVKTDKVLGPWRQSCTDEKGEFSIKSIPAGTYRIVVNETGEITAAQPFETFYYPNVAAREQATRVTFGPDFFLKNVVLVPPRMPEMIVLSGRLTYSDGTPAAGENVQFFSDDEAAKADASIAFSGFETRTGRDGEFTLKILKGKSGILRATFFTFPGNDENCPEVEEILKTGAGNIRQLETNRQRIAGAENVSGIALKFPFPGCGKTNPEGNQK